MAVVRKHIAVAGLACASALVAAQTVAQAVDFWAYDLRIASLDSNTDASMFHWVAGAALLAIAASFALLARRRGRQRRILLALAAIFALLFVDNRTDLHHRVAHGTALLLPLLAVGFVLLLEVSRIAPPQACLLLRAGVASLALSLVIHLLGPPLLHAIGWSQGDWPYQIKVAFKQGTELGGWLLVAFGALAFVVAQPTTGTRSSTVR